MKYRIISIKPKPFIAPKSLPPSFGFGKLSVKNSIFPHTESKDKYLVQLDWTYKCEVNNIHLLTYEAESKFEIEYDEVPLDKSHVERVIGDIYINVELGWEGQTANNSLAGSTLPMIDFSLLAAQIIDLFPR